MFPHSLFSIALPAWPDLCRHDGVATILAPAVRPSGAGRRFSVHLGVICAFTSAVGRAGLGCARRLTGRQDEDAAAGRAVRSGVPTRTLRLPYGQGPPCSEMEGSRRGSGLRPALRALRHSPVHFGLVCALTSRWRNPARPVGSAERGARMRMTPRAVVFGKFAQARDRAGGKARSSPNMKGSRRPSRLRRALRDSSPLPRSFRHDLRFYRWWHGRTQAPIPHGRGSFRVARVSVLWRRPSVSRLDFPSA